MYPFFHYWVFRERQAKLHIRIYARTTKKKVYMNLSSILEIKGAKACWELNLGLGRPFKRKNVFLERNFWPFWHIVHTKVSNFTYFRKVQHIKIKGASQFLIIGISHVIFYKDKNNFTFSDVKYIQKQITLPIWEKLSRLKMKKLRNFIKLKFHV